MRKFLDHLHRLTASPSTALSALAAFALFVAADRLLRRIVELPVDRLTDASLLMGAVRANLFLVIVLVAVVLYRPSRLWSVDWEDLGPLRVLATVLVIVVLWRRTTAPYDWFHQQWFLIDRAFLFAAAVIAFLRPAGLLVFVFLARLLAEPVAATVPAPGENIVALPLLILVAIAVSALLVAHVSNYRNEAVVPVMVAAVAAQFWLPGRIKLTSGWAWNNDLANLPLNGHAQGWLGAGDGELAMTFADSIGAVEPALLLATLAIEVGALIVVFSRKLVRWWLLALVTFHAAVFLSLGFVFLEFVAVEILLFVVLGRADWREFSAPSFDGLTPFIAAAAVFLASIVFQPPTLVWYDANAVSRIEVDGIDASGTRWALEPAHFSPYSDVFAFSGFWLDPGPSIVDGYGSASRARFDDLKNVRTLEELETLEASISTGCDPSADGAVSDLLNRFLEESRTGHRLQLPGPPRHFQISRGGQTYDFSVPLESIEVQRVTVLRVDGAEVERRQDVEWDQERCLKLSRRKL